MSAHLPASALREFNEAYKKITPPRVFALCAGKHFGSRAPRLNPEQLQKSLEAVHEQYQRGYRGLRLRRNAAMRMAGHCNTNPLLVLVLPAVAGQLARLYQRWRVKAGVTDTSGAFPAAGGGKKTGRPPRKTAKAG